MAAMGLGARRTELLRWVILLVVIGCGRALAEDGTASQVEKLRIELARERGGKQAYEDLLDKLEARRFKAEETARQADLHKRDAEIKLAQTQRSLEAQLSKSKELEQELRDVRQKYSATSARLNELQDSHEKQRVQLAQVVPAFEKTVTDREEVRMRLARVQAELHSEQNQFLVGRAYRSARDSTIRASGAVENKVRIVRRASAHVSTVLSKIDAPTLPHISMKGLKRHLVGTSQALRNLPAPSLTLPAFAGVVDFINEHFPKRLLHAPETFGLILRKARVKASALMEWRPDFNVRQFFVTTSSYLSKADALFLAAYKFFKYLNKESLLVLAAIVCSMLLVITLPLLTQTRRSAKPPPAYTPEDDAPSDEDEVEEVPLAHAVLEKEDPYPGGLPSPPSAQAVRRKPVRANGPTPAQMRFLRGESSSSRH